VSRGASISSGACRLPLASRFRAGPATGRASTSTEAAITTTQRSARLSARASRMVAQSIGSESRALSSSALSARRADSVSTCRAKVLKGRPAWAASFSSPEIFPAQPRFACPQNCFGLDAVFGVFQGQGEPPPQGITTPQ